MNLSEALHVLAANRWKVDIREKPHKYEFSVVPRAVTVLVPNTYDGELLESGSLRTSEHALNGKAQQRQTYKAQEGVRSGGC